MSNQSLSKCEQKCLAHLQRAEELEVSLREYAEAYGLEVKALYNGKRQLKKKGVLDKQAIAREDFVEVQLVGSGETPVCRLQHPSGWEISCHDWPPAVWLSALVSGGEDAS